MLNVPIKEKVIDQAGFINRIWRAFFEDVSRSGLIDRGDPSANDFTVGDFTIDAAWHDLDLSSIVPAGAKAVYLRLTLVNNTPGELFYLRKNGNANAINISVMRAQVNGIYNDLNVVVPCDANRKIEYYASNGGTWAAVYLVVLGWHL